MGQLPAVALVMTAGWALGQTRPAPADFVPSATYRLLDFALEATARDIERRGARPTVNSRELFLACAALYDAWALHEDEALPSHAVAVPRAPLKARSDTERARAMLAALGVVLKELFPSDASWVDRQVAARGVRGQGAPGSPEALGQAVGQAVLQARRHDGANQLGDEVGASPGVPYADHTFYRPVNGEVVVDADRWQPIPFELDGGVVARPGFLTPHWYKVRPFGLSRADAFRPPPPPRVGSKELAAQVDEVLRLNASLTLEQKALVEFMRDGPRSTGQSGHWLRFAQAVSRRDGLDLHQDVRLYFAVAAACFDAFIAAWDAKRAYDTSRPWTLVRVLYAGKQVRGWLGPGRGVGTLPAAAWAPYSPRSFVTPPFPGYVSGHSAVSAAAARTLALFTGSDVFGDEERRLAGELTEPGVPVAALLKVDGKVPAGLPGSAEVVLPLPTFSATAELAGRSRVLGGYHVEADNLEGLKLGRAVAEAVWPVTRALFEGRALGK